MSCLYYIEKVLGIQDISEIKIENTEEITHIFIKHQRKKCHCPECNTITDKIHDYREQKIKDLKLCGKPVLIHLKKRRYVCPKCNKRFYEATPYLVRYARRTTRMTMQILDDLAEVKSFTAVARDYGVSVTTVQKIFDHISYGKPQLPLVLSIDEFKGNTGGEKYNCILADPLNHRVLDILPQRYEHKIMDYFLEYSYESREKVEYFISDMWKPYQDSAKALFNNSTRVIDKYHWMRQVIWAFERVRKDVQKHMCVERRIYFKHSRKLLIKPFASLSDEDKQAVNNMLYYSADMSTAHFYKEEFQKISRERNLVTARKLMDDWIACALECGVRPLEECAKTMQYWKKEILNSYCTSCEKNGAIAPTARSFSTTSTEESTTP